MNSNKKNDVDLAKQYHKMAEDQLKARHNLEEEQFRAAFKQMQKRHDFEREQLKIQQKAQITTIDSSDTSKDKGVEPNPLKKAKDAYAEMGKKEVAGYRVDELLKAPVKPPKSKE